MADAPIERGMGALRRIGRHIPLIRTLGLRRGAEELRQVDAASLDAATGSTRPAPLWQPPGHYFSPVTDPAELLRRRKALFRPDTVPPRVPLPGIDLTPDLQMDMFRRIVAARELLPLAQWADPLGPTRYRAENGAFPLADALVLGALLATFRPRRVLEVGSGHSSCALLDMRDRLGGVPAEITLVEPFPDLLHHLLGPRDLASVMLIPAMAQDMDPELVRALEPGDVLFVDSTHVAKTGSDVLHHFFTILPAVAPGVLVHLHDVFWPFEYPESWALQENRSWNELYLLRAFLMHNRDWEVLFFPDWFRRAHPEETRTHLPELMDASVTSFWLRKRDPG